MEDLFFLQPAFLLGAIWFVIPAYVANSTPTILGGGRTIDGGRLWRDNKRLLGDGKTWRGLVLGTLTGTIIGFLQFFLEENNTSGIDISIFRAFLLSFGALLGDIIGSFIKRRKNLKRGESFLFMDQLGFIIMGTILVLIFSPLTINNVSFSVFGVLIEYNGSLIILYLILILPITFLVHIAANLLWYLLGKQEVPL